MRKTLGGRHTTLGVAAIVLSASAWASESASPGSMTPGTDPHAKHRQMLATPDVTVEHLVYQVPNVTLVDESGQRTNLRELFSEDKPIALNFIFTTCTTICPVMTSTMLQLQKHLGDETVRPNFVSISIDPDYDSVAVMKDYAERFGANWTFLTGSPDDVLTALRAFDAYRGNKVNHFALTLMHAPAAKDWTRVEGLTSAEELARLWRETAN